MKPKITQNHRMGKWLAATKSSFGLFWANVDVKRNIFSLQSFSRCWWRLIFIAISIFFCLGIDWTNDDDDDDDDDDDEEGDDSENDDYDDDDNNDDKDHDVDDDNEDVVADDNYTEDVDGSSCWKNYSWINNEGQEPIF